MKVIPTGKICSRCSQGEGYRETDTMCPNCYDKYVVQYLKSQLASALERLAGVRRYENATAEEKPNGQ